LAFIDADKVNNPHYVRWALELGRPGSVIVVDNVVRGGAVIDTGNDDPSVRGTRETVELLRAEPRLDATALQTVGGKGYDGIIIARVVSWPSAHSFRTACGAGGESPTDLAQSAKITTQPADTTAQPADTTTQTADTTTPGRDTATPCSCPAGSDQFLFA